MRTVLVKDLPMEERLNLLKEIIHFKLRNLIRFKEHFFEVLDLNQSDSSEEEEIEPLVKGAVYSVLTFGQYLGVREEALDLMSPLILAYEIRNPFY